MSKPIRAVFRAAIVAIAATLPLTAQAQTVPQITSMGSTPPSATMWIGNSFFYFNNGITSHITQFSRADKGGPRFSGTMVTMGGSGFDWHDVESYFRPDGVGKYVFDEKNNIIFNNNAKKYDAAVLMDCSQCPLHPTLAPVFVKYAKIDTDIVRSHDAVPVLFMSWAYADKPEMTAQLAEAYTKAGNDNRAMVIPAGLAFARALKARPTLNLYIADNRHPTLAGTYLAAATSYAALYRRSLEDHAYTAGLDPELAKFLRVTAWATVQDYYSGAVTN
jgi:hypothetical protein